MVSWIISRLVVLVFGTLYPAYSSYKAVKSKDVKEYMAPKTGLIGKQASYAGSIGQSINMMIYAIVFSKSPLVTVNVSVKWMMYWIIFALFTSVEVFTDMFLCWLPFYYELKIAFVVWLLSPYTKGSSVLYRKFVHPTLSSKEKDIDDYICQAKDKSYDTLVHYGRKGLNVAATAAVMAATKGQGVLTDRLRSFSMQDLAGYDSDTASSTQSTRTEAAAQHRARTMMRSKSESYNKDFDMTDYEVLALDQRVPEESLTPDSSPPSTPSPTPPALGEPEEGTKVARGAQLGFVKRKAPEPPLRVLRPLTRSRSAVCSNSDAM